MPRYFFHTQCSSRFTDEDGIDYATPVEARAEAIRSAGEMMRDAPEEFWGSRPWEVTVTNEVGLVLWELSMDGFSSPAARGA
jgi:hypothetical protein